jgi:hypothetical protein
MTNSRRLLLREDKAGNDLPPTEVAIRRVLQTHKDGPVMTDRKMRHDTRRLRQFLDQLFRFLDAVHNHVPRLLGMWPELRWVLATPSELASFEAINILVGSEENTIGKLGLFDCTR